MSIQVTELFKALDTEGSGSITYSKAYLVFETFRINISHKEFLDRIYQIDYNRKGLLNLYDFEKIYKSHIKPSLPSYESLVGDLEKILPDELNAEVLADTFTDLSKLDIDLLLEDIQSDGKNSLKVFIDKIKERI